MNSVRIGDVVDPPWVNECFFDYPKHCKYAGFDIEFIYAVLANTFRMNVIWSTYDNYKSLESALNTNAIDVVADAYHLFEIPNIKNLYHTTIVQYYDLSFLTKSYLNSLETSNIFTAFKLDMWFSLVIVTIIVYSMKHF